MASKKKPPKKRAPGRPEDRIVIDDPADALQRLLRAPPKKRPRKAS